jgi:hypothetical protein
MLSWGREILQGFLLTKYDLGQKQIWGTPHGPIGAFLEFLDIYFIKETY